MLRRRLGSALLLIALITLLVFLVTASAGNSNLDTLLAGLAFAFLGWLLRRGTRRERQPHAASAPCGGSWDAPCKMTLAKIKALIPDFWVLAHEHTRG